MSNKAKLYEEKELPSYKRSKKFKSIKFETDFPKGDAFISYLNNYMKLIIFQPLLDSFLKGEIEIQKGLKKHFMKSSSWRGCLGHYDAG